MNFISLTFVIFVLVTLFCYNFVSQKFKLVVLLASSYIFYSTWDWRFSFLLLYLTVSNFLFSKLMIKKDKLRDKQKVLTVCLFQNLIILGIFKYTNFFIESLAAFLRALGIQVNYSSLRIILPLGLSFFIFQTSSYIIDLYRNDIKAEVSFLNFATFVSYFPHMAAGPIMKAKDFLPQLKKELPKLTLTNFQNGLMLISLGLMRKVVLADQLAPFVNRTYENWKYFDWKVLVLATLAFGLQIYGDFSGYSLIARGVSRIFGIEMMNNFRQPYLASSPSDFWHRWHISLSTWFRDYLYVPIGGNRSKTFKKYFNLIIVMTIAGFWHGAAWGFILWGFLHGIYLVLDKLLKVYFYKSTDNEKFRVLISWFITQCLMFGTWIFFRLPDVNSAFDYINSIIKRQTGALDFSDLSLVFIGTIIFLVLDFLEIYLIRNINKISDFVRGLVISAFISTSLVFKSATIIPFIYFRF